jgi:hypothetical protein
VSYIHIFETLPQAREVDGLAQNGAETGNAFGPCQDAGQRRIDGYEADVDIQRRRSKSAWADCPPT